MKDLSAVIFLIGLICIDSVQIRLNKKIISHPGDKKAPKHLKEHMKIHSKPKIIKKAIITSKNKEGFPFFNIDDYQIVQSNQPKKEQQPQPEPQPIQQQPVVEDEGKKNITDEVARIDSKQSEVIGKEIVEQNKLNPVEEAKVEAIVDRVIIQNDRDPELTPDEKEKLNEQLATIVDMSIGQVESISEKAVEKEEIGYNKAKVVTTEINGLANCGFKDISAFRGFYVGVSMDIYEESLACGACMKIEGPDGVIITRVVDSIGNGKNTLSLSKEAFHIISNGDKEHINNVKWKWVDCGKKEGMELEVIKGSNPWYIAVRPYFANNRIRKAEILDTNTGTWQEMTRRNDNAFFYSPASGIEAPFKFRFTDVDFKTVEGEIDGLINGQMYIFKDNF
ncbi:MAG: hypothetical protein MJ252_02495 [archaeon]|nr:hypothetical protein [archaeon]